MPDVDVRVARWLSFVRRLTHVTFSAMVERDSEERGEPVEGMSAVRYCGGFTPERLARR